MNIWFTTAPRVLDFPIWAYVDDENDVVLIRSLEEFVHEDKPITWTHARIPKPPLTNHVDFKFLQLSKNECNIGWGNREWFRAGYSYGLLCREISGCNKKTDISNPNKNPSISNSNTGWKS